MKKVIAALVIIVILLFASAVLSACAPFAINIPIEKSNYDISVALDCNSNTLTGCAQITYHSRRKGLDELSLQLHANAYRDTVVSEQYITYAYPKGKISHGGIEIGSITSDTHSIASYATAGSDMTLLRIKLSKPLAHGEKIVFTVNYTITLPKIKHRLGYSDYVYNIAHFYPVMCVYEDGGFLEYEYSKLGDPFYSELSDYTVRLTLPKNFVAAHTGTISGEQNNEDGTKTLVINADNVRDFALAASPYFILRTDTVGDITVKYYYIEETDGNKRMELITSVLAAYSSYYCPYPYSTLTVVRTPFAFGGMEYPQLVYISDSLDTAYTDLVIAHELAHQWWYALVGNDQIRYAWLDEALAEFSTYLYYRKNSPKLYKQYFNESYAKYVRYASITGLTGANSAMDDILYNYDDYRYSANVYTKGMLMLMSLYEIKGEALIAALSDYAVANQYKIATPEIFIASLSASLNTPQQSYFDAWIKGKVILL